MRNMFSINIATLSTFLLTTFLTNTYSVVSDDFIAKTDAAIENIRKRDAVVQLQDATGTPLTGRRAVRFKQIRNHFGFGAAVKYADMVEHKENYWNAVTKYFEWVTPEHEMKWDFIDKLEDFQNFREADSLIKWSHDHGMKVRGHNLFWNERLEFQPPWTKELSSGAEFKEAMQRRIETAMTHYKGQVEHWDIMNEIIHEEFGIIQDTGLYIKLTGDPDIYPWVFKEARKWDPDVKMAVNEYQILTPNSDAVPYAERINEFLAAGAEIDIIGLEGHLGYATNQIDYDQRMNIVANTTPDLEMWFTEVDFSDTLGRRADIMEEIMRTAFAFPRVGGIVMWVWWNGRRWRETINSVLVDSQFVETDLGERFRTMREKWRTDTTVLSDENGLVSMRGFHGTYQVFLEAFPDSPPDTIIIDPGTGPASFNMATSINYRAPTFSTAKINFRGRVIDLPFSISLESQLFVSTYSLSGRLLDKKPIIMKNGTGHILGSIPNGCYIYRLGTSSQNLFTVKEASVH